MSFSPSPEYLKKYQESIENPEQFWSKELDRLDWITRPQTIQNTDFNNDVTIKWFEDGQLNPCYNCVDRHVKAGNGNKLAIIWEGDEPGNNQFVTYNELLEKVSIMANILEEQGVKKGDVIIIYLPMIPEAVYAMLASARIGAIHSVVFGGFSANALKDRIADCKPKLIVTADEAIRGGKTVPLKENVDHALLALSTNNAKTLVVRNTGNKIHWYPERDLWHHEQEVPKIHNNFAIMQSTDPLFILYTSGSTGKPKGLVHSTAGYLLYTHITFQYSFDYQPGDIFWCSADVGWITGHSYVVYGPLLHGATTLLYEGVLSHPTYARFWQIIDKYQVTTFYTAPTAIRALMKEGNDYVEQTSRDSLRILGTVGEPINPEAWQWYHQVIGKNKCQIVDTWWQTETGGHMIAPLPNLIKPKPGYACLPFFGVETVILDDHGSVVNGESEGNLCIARSWPGQAFSIWGDHARFKKTYFSHFPGYYFTGDGAKRDDDHYYRITGRVDDVINVSGHRISTAEVEAAIDKHYKVCESATVGFPHEIKGEGIYVFVILNHGEQASDQLIHELKQLARKEIGAIVTPDVIHFTEDLPKTRSGKIMRRIIRKIAARDFNNLGDLSSLNNPQIVQDLINQIVDKVN